MFTLENVFFYSLLTWSTITLLDKWSIREYLSGHAPNRLIQKAIECNFCFAHHLTLVFVIPQLIINFDLSILFVPLFSATIINKCLN